MDQDFHYYGTYYAARIGGNYSQEDATVIAKASNFIEDFGLTYIPHPQSFSLRVTSDREL